MVKNIILLKVLDMHHQIFVNKIMKKMNYLKYFEGFLNEMYDFKLTPIVISEENYLETMELRRKMEGSILNFRGLGIGTFLTAIWLFRIIDEFEFEQILKSKKITGGKWAVKVERDFGASFTGSREDAINFGLKWKKADRLKGKLYLISINGDDKEFLNISMEERLEEQGLKYEIGDFLINTKLGDSGLGFSIRNANLSNIRHIYEVSDSGNLNDITHEYDNIIYP